MLASQEFFEDRLSSFNLAPDAWASTEDGSNFQITCQVVNSIKGKHGAVIVNDCLQTFEKQELKGQIGIASILENVAIDDMQASQALDIAQELLQNDHKYAKIFGLRLIASIGYPRAKSMAATLLSVLGKETDGEILDWALLAFGKTAEVSRGNFSVLTGTNNHTVDSSHHSKFGTDTRLSAIACILDRSTKAKDVLGKRFKMSNPANRCAVMSCLKFAASWYSVVEWADMCKIPDDSEPVVKASARGLEAYHNPLKLINLHITEADKLDRDVPGLIESWRRLSAIRSDHLGWPWPVDPSNDFIAAG